MAPDAALKLRAEDGDDLAVISACVQDALVSVRDLIYDRAGHGFTLVANRFRWEGQRPPDGSQPDGTPIDGTPEDGAPPFERTHCAVAVGAVEKVSYRGFRRSNNDRILALLAIRVISPPVGDKTGTIDLEFSGGATVRLTVSAIEVRAADVGEPWPTAWQPDHAADSAP